MYEAVADGDPITQGDIIDDCPLLALSDPAGAFKPDVETEIVRARVIILSQACDLAQVGRGTKVLGAAISEARLLVEEGILKASTIRDNVRRHQTFGWYFLPAAAPPLMLPESIVDLRELHTLNRTVLEQLAGSGKRACRLQTPYREHLAQHFAVTYMRIALPEPYETEP